MGPKREKNTAKKVKRSRCDKSVSVMQRPERRNSWAKRRKGKYCKPLRRTISRPGYKQGKQKNQQKPQTRVSKHSATAKGGPRHGARPNANKTGATICRSRGKAYVAEPHTGATVDGSPQRKAGTGAGTSTGRRRLGTHVQDKNTKLSSQMSVASHHG